MKILVKFAWVAFCGLMLLNIFTGISKEHPLILFAALFFLILTRKAED